MYNKEKVLKFLEIHNFEPKTNEQDSLIKVTLEEKFYGVEVGFHLRDRDLKVFVTNLRETISTSVIMSQIENFESKILNYIKENVPWE